MTDKTDTSFDWGSLGEARWRELGEAAGASELQLRFAALRFGGATATGAAKGAGYAGTRETIRRAGYDALRSTAVQNLLELAAINAPEDAKISEKEIDAKLAKLVRSPDANVSLKAIEGYSKREAARKEREADEQWNDRDALLVEFLEGFGDSRGAVVASLWGWYSAKAPKSEILYFIEPILRDLAPIVAADFPDVWRRLVADEPDDRRADFAKLAERPRKSIPEIIAEAKARSMRNFNGSRPAQIEEIENVATQ